MSTIDTQMTKTNEIKQTLSDFIAKLNIQTVKCEPKNSNPNMLTWTNARHWLVTLVNTEGVKLSIPFSQGLGHTEPPNAEDVLDCLASDSYLVDCSRDFQDWKDSLGYEDLKEARKTYQAYKRQSKMLKDWLGDDKYQDLLYEVERL